MRSMFASWLEGLYEQSPKKHESTFVLKIIMCSYLASFPGLPCLQLLITCPRTGKRSGDKTSSYLHKHSRLAAASGKGAPVRGQRGPPPCREACPSTAAEEHSRPRSRPQSPWRLCLQTWGVASFISHLHNNNQ